MDVAQAILVVIQAWGIFGALTAAVFLTVGIERVDEDAQGAYVFRPLLIPGVMLIWPLVLWRWWRIESQRAGWAERYKPVRGAHGAAALLMSLGIIAIIVTGLSVRQEWPGDTAPVQLSDGASQ
ncbi:hypothetical protein [Tateyamaria pelophila]|uniref:hypothetical protein n=1 Tax=Tateyamaria pelophila TaxID=328415 RepID=UPI001CC1AAEF|nr:hypothetical protein [Tateyamaria pelophila]